MRRKLFLTIAMVFAFFAGANAQQTWNMTLSGSEGLPGTNVKKGEYTVTLYQSGVIKPGKAIESLRFTVAQTKSNAGPFFALSELTVLSADRQQTISYTATSNADHNTLAGSKDGDGLPALNDGNWGTYFHSMWAAEPAVDGSHYIELTFTEPVESFILEWGARADNPKDAPAVVVLTEGGVNVAPYSDRSFELKDKATELSTEKFYVMRSNAATTYDIYDRATGKVPDDSKNLEGCGPRYMTMANTWSSEATIDYVFQLLPASNGKYYVYYPNQEAYLAKSELNDAKNGNQSTTTLKSNAAEIEITKDTEGNFEMRYVNNEDEVVYIGADPRAGQPVKILAEERRPALDENGWCEGFSIKLAWGWTIFEADYQMPEWTNAFKLAKVYQQVTTLKDITTIPEFDATSIITEIEEKMLEDMTADATKEYINGIKNEIHDMFYDALETEWSLLQDEELPYYKDLARNEPTSGFCDMKAYETYIEGNLFNKVNDLLNAADADEEVPYFYDNMSEVVSYFNGKQGNINTFLASKFELLNFTFKVSSDKFLGAQQEDKRIVWEQTFMLGEATTGFRMTFLETYPGSSANKYTVNGQTYDIVALAELEIRDADDNIISFTASTNSQETSEGPIEYLSDGIANESSNFWHSIWGNGTMSPEGYVYLDIKFNDAVSLNRFTIKTTSREHQNGGLAPKTIAFTEFGSVYNPLLDRPNTYNVAEVKQITDPAELKENGLYIISGNLRVNDPASGATPRFYSGAAPYLKEKQGALNDTCVYALKKAADGNWNILSLAHGKYWSEDGGLTADRSKAASINVAKSNNMPKAMILFSIVPDKKVSASWASGTESDVNPAVTIDSAEVVVNRRVYMDWDSGLAERLCVSEQPGVFTHGYDVISQHTMADKIIGGNGYSAGDYLHFNKTNGEGEWNIYEVTMDTPDFVYLKSLANMANNDELWVLGNNPGCIKMSDADKKAYDEAVAAATVAVNENETANAATLAKNLEDAIQAGFSSNRIGFDASCEYAIVSALEAFYNNNQQYRAMYAYKNQTLGDLIDWKNCPAEFNDENREFLFTFTEINESNMGAYEIEVPEEHLGKAYFIKNAANGLYAGAMVDNRLPMFEIDQAGLFIFENLEKDVYNILVDGNTLHAQGHASGAGQSGEIVNWGGGVNSASAWRFVLVNGDINTAVENIVVEGDEVVAVEYYTPAGVAIAAPVKGINIIIKRYANGVVEATKVVVK